MPLYSLKAQHLFTSNGEKFDQNNDKVKKKLYRTPLRYGPSLNGHHLI